MDAELWAEVRRLSRREGWSIRRIARELRLAPKTVKRVLRQEHYEPRKYSRPRRSKLDPYKEVVRQTLEKYPDLSQVRLLEELRARGYTGGPTILRSFVRAVRPRRQSEAFLRIDFPPGDAAQVDWAHCGTILVDGRPTRLSAFLFILCWSRHLYVEFTTSERLEVFLACHEHAFRSVGGVVRRGLYDNLRSVVLAHVGREVRFHPRFLDFAQYQGFQPVACNPYRPHEKGRIENSVLYLRQNFLAGREMQDLDTLNREVARWLAEVANVRLHATTRRRPVDLLAEERSLLGPLPSHPYDTRIVVPLRASPLCRVRFENNTYSVPPEHAGSLLTLKASDDEIVLYAKAAEIARHPRAHGRGSDVVDPQHVRALLERKRRGERGAIVNRFLALSPLAHAYLEGLTHAEIALYRHLRRILALADRYGREDVAAAMAQALAHRAFGAEYVERILEQDRRRKNLEPLPPLRALEQAPDLADVSLPDIDLSLYDQVLGTGGLDEERPEGTTAGEPPSPQPAADPRDLPRDPPPGDAPQERAPHDP